MATSYVSIPDFFEGQSIFITGVTGFLGKVLLEKLLRSCSKLNKIYILMRPKRGQSSKDRLDSLLDSKLFESLLIQQPNSREKIVIVNGDLMEPRLGISDEDMLMLERQITIIFHSAATVKFDEPLKLAIQLNLQAVRMILDLAKKVHNLKALVHVSTAYCNCDILNIDEVIYPPSLHPNKLLDALEWMDEDILDQVTPRLLGKKPNTYTFTKQLAEFLISEECASLPISIVRPSIVTAAWQEPIKGWVDNFNGPTGLMAAISKGVLRSILGNKHAVADLIPVDSVVNSMIAVAWNTASAKRTTASPAIYNCTTGQINKFTWGQLESLSNEFMLKNPMNSCIRVPKAKFTKSSTWHQLNWIVNHQLPACILDLWMYASGGKAIYTRYSQKILKSLQSVEYFTSHEWNFRNDRILELFESLSAVDKKEFNFDCRNLNWNSYVEHYALGIREYALKEDKGGLEKARANIKRLQRLSFIFNSILVVLLWRILLKRTRGLSQIWTLMLSLASNIFQKIPNFARS